MYSKSLKMKVLLGSKPQAMMSLIFSFASLSDSSNSRALQHMSGNIHSQNIDIFNVMRKTKALQLLISHCSSNHHSSEESEGDHWESPCLGPAMLCGKAVSTKAAPEKSLLVVRDLDDQGDLEGVLEVLREQERYEVSQMKSLRRRTLQRTFDQVRSTIACIPRGQECICEGNLCIGKGNGHVGAGGSRAQCRGRMAVPSHSSPGCQSCLCGCRRRLASAMDELASL